MARTVQNTDTFETWRLTTNAISQDVDNVVVAINANVAILQAGQFESANINAGNILVSGVTSTSVKTNQITTTTLNSQEITTGPIIVNQVTTNSIISFGQILSLGNVDVLNANVTVTNGKISAPLANITSLGVDSLFASNVSIDGLVTADGNPKFSVYRTTDRTLGITSLGYPGFDAAEFDTASSYVLGTALTQDYFNVPEDGFYSLSAGIRLQFNNTASISLTVGTANITGAYIYSTKAITFAQQHTTGFYAGNCFLSVSKLLNLTKNQRVKITTSFGNPPSPIVIGGNTTSWFTGHRVA